MRFRLTRASRLGSEATAPRSSGSAALIEAIVAEDQSERLSRGCLPARGSVREVQSQADRPRIYQDRHRAGLCRKEVNNAGYWAMRPSTG